MQGPGEGLAVLEDLWAFFACCTQLSFILAQVQVNMCISTFAEGNLLLRCWRFLSCSFSFVYEARIQLVP